MGGVWEKQLLHCYSVTLSFFKWLNYDFRARKL